MGITQLTTAIIMKQAIYNKLAALMLLLMGLTLAACDSNDMDSSDLSMGGDNLITSFSINGAEGKIDNVNKTITVWLAPGTDLTRLQPEFTLPEGAVSNIPSGSTVDFTMPVVFKITNGNTYIDYTVTAKVFEAKINTMSLADASGTRYEGTVDNDARTVQVYLPAGTDVTRLTLYYTLSEGAEGSIASGATVSLAEPLQFTVASHGVEATYTITAEATDMPKTAFIGTAATVDGLTDEEKAAARWMLANVPRAVYISMQDIISGQVQLDPQEYKALWWHGDRSDWPSQAWDSRDAIKNYYANGGSLFLSRYACRYINDVYQIAKDQKQPNAEEVANPAETLSSPAGFTVDDADHAIFSGLDAVKDQPIYLIDKGFTITNTRVNWNIYDYPNHSLEGWENATGGKRLAYQSDDSNKTAIVEFPAASKSAGRVILIGTGCFEWNVAGDADNQYAANRAKLAVNVLRYLAGE